MPKCVCGREIEDWEVVCNYCWQILGKYDSKFKTDFRASLVKSFNETGKRTGIDSAMMKLIEERLMSETAKRIEKLKSKMKRICKECELKEKKEIDICFKCPIHELFNEMLQEALNGK